MTATASQNAKRDHGRGRAHGKDSQHDEHHDDRRNRHEYLEHAHRNAVEATSKVSGCETNGHTENQDGCNDFADVYQGATSAVNELAEYVPAERIGARR